MRLKLHPAPPRRDSVPILRRLALVLLPAALACKSSSEPSPPANTPRIQIVQGNQQAGVTGQPLPVVLGVRLRDAQGKDVGPGTKVAWIVEFGGGSAAADTTLTDANSVAHVDWTLGAAAGGNALRAVYPAVDSVGFHGTGTGSFTVAAGGGNVPERYGSDLWVADGFGYSGTWYGPRIVNGPVGNAVKIWQLSPTGAPALVDSIVVPGIADVSDVEVSADGRWLVFTSEGGPNAGLYVYELTAPGVPVFRATAVVPEGLHTGTLAVIGGTLYAFAAKDPASCALRIFDLSQAAAGTITVASSTPIPDNYCIHDTFVRDGYAFVFAWNEGLYIFDVGNGSSGGTPATPVQLSQTLGFGGETHNGWWFHNPANGENRYLFIGEEGPGGIGTSSSGDIHVVDVSNLAAPVEVGSFHLPGAGAHNFWMDEPAQRLYAAYYNGGVVALDVSGTLRGDLSSRVIAQLTPGGTGQTYVWGVMLYNNSLYVSDMISGFWQLGVP